MRQYIFVSGSFLALLTCVQLTRLVLRWPITVAGVDIPLWASGVAVLVVGSLTVWAFRVASTSKVSS